MSYETARLDAVTSQVLEMPHKQLTTGGGYRYLSC